MKVLIAGATGLVGTHLRQGLERAGHTCESVSRQAGRGYTWERSSLEAGVAACDAVVQLAGAGVIDRRWSPAYKREIRTSRVDTTRALAWACARSGRTLISSSAVGYYGPTRMGDPRHEDSPPGDDFLAHVCRDWEDALEPARQAGVPVAVVRLGVVLAARGGALARMLGPFRLGLGGPIGAGTQPFPWVHMDDVVRLLGGLATEAPRPGVYNAVAPGICDQRSFARELGRALHRPALLPAPGLALRALLGERAELLTTGQHVEPRHTLRSGFEFAHPELAGALQSLLA